MAKDGAHSERERIAGTFVDLRLQDSWYLVFDRVFQCYDLIFRFFQGIDHRVEGRGLTGAGGTRDEDHALFLFQRIQDDFFLRSDYPEAIEIDDIGRGVQYTADDALAVACRHDRDADVDLRIMPLFSEPEFPVLWHIMDIEFEIRSVFHPFDDHRVLLCPDDTNCGEVAVDAESDFRIGFVQFEMHIGRTETYGSFDERHESPIRVLPV